jgi:dethiobiotin synthetase
MQTKPHPLPDIFVVGTDTGVGKSVVSLLLMQRLFARGFHPFYLKPFQTGCRDAHDVNSDARFVYRHTAALKDRDPSGSVIYCHPNPKAPYFAARDEGQSIDPEAVFQAVIQKRKDHSPLVIEAAGGLLVPVTRKLLVIDVVQALDCRPLLVARAGLGTINHTLLSIEALRRRGLEPLGVVLVDQPQQPAAPDLVQENKEAIETCGQVPVGGVIGVLSNLAAPSEEFYRPLEKLLFTGSA